MSHELLIFEQKCDLSLAPLFDVVVSDNAMGGWCTGYFLTEGVLMRKWMPPRFPTGWLGRCDASCGSTSNHLAVHLRVNNLGINLRPCPTMGFFGQYWKATCGNTVKHAMSAKSRVNLIRSFLHILSIPFPWLVSHLNMWLLTVLILSPAQKLVTSSSWLSLLCHSISWSHFCAHHCPCCSSAG